MDSGTREVGGGPNETSSEGSGRKSGSFVVFGSLKEVEKR